MCVHLMYIAHAEKFWRQVDENSTLRRTGLRLFETTQIQHLLYIQILLPHYFSYPLLRTFTQYLTCYKHNLLILLFGCKQLFS